MLELSVTYSNSDNELLLGEVDGRPASLTLQNFRRLENQPPPGRGDLKYDRFRGHKMGLLISAGPRGHMPTCTLPI